MMISGALALGGLSGVILDDAQFRNIGIVGYAGVFPVAALLLAILFYRARSPEAGKTQPRLSPRDDKAAFDQTSS
jgi:hypothetical protein